MSRHEELASPSAAARPSALGASRPRAETTAAVALGVAALALYLPVLRDLVSVWLRVTYYSYGFLVPLFSAYLAREAWNASDGAPPRPAPAGLLVTAAGLTTLALGIAADSLSLRALSLPGVLLGLVLLTLGPAHARRLAFPIGFLVFMAPLPEGALPALSLPLQRLAALVAEHALGALGVAVTRDDLYLRLPSVTLHVTEACNGLRNMMLFIAVCSAVAFTVKRPLIEKAIIMLSAVPIALIANLVRITATAVLHSMSHHELANTTYHDLAGWFMMPLAVVLLWVELAILRRVFVAALTSGPMAKPSPIDVAYSPKATPRSSAPSSPPASARAGGHSAHTAGPVGDRRGGRQRRGCCRRARRRPPAPR